MFGLKMLIIVIAVYLGLEFLGVLSLSGLNIEDFLPEL